MNDSDFYGLNFINHLSAQESIFCISGLRTIAAVSGFSTKIYNVVSSAINRKLELISDTISFMNTKNIYGPSIKPCWTPALIFCQSGSTPGKTTLFAITKTGLKPFQYSAPVTPAAFNLHNKPLCQTRSNALLMSQNTTLISFPAPNASQKVSYRNVN